MHRSNPKVLCGGRLHHKKLMDGRGMGSVILDKGGAGSASSYESVDAFMNATGEQIKGSGLGEKLHKLLVKPLGKKPANIKWDK